jgi:hypothetical protein
MVNSLPAQPWSIPCWRNHGQAASPWAPECIRGHPSNRALECTQVPKGQTAGAQRLEFTGARLGLADSSQARPLIIGQNRGHAPKPGTMFLPTRPPPNDSSTIERLLGLEAHLTQGKAREKERARLETPFSTGQKWLRRAEAGATFLPTRAWDRRMRRPPARGDPGATRGDPTRPAYGVTSSIHTGSSTGTSTVSAVGSG